jgi:hypothetical protein
MSIPPLPQLLHGARQLSEWRMPGDSHDAFLRTLRPSTHGPARSRSAGRTGSVRAPRSTAPNRAAWSSLHNPAASPSKMQPALVDLVSGSNLRRLLRDNCAWDLPPANLAEVLAVERPLHGSTCGSSLAIGSQAASPGYATRSQTSIAAPGGASLRELVLEEEAVALQAEGAALRAQLQRIHGERQEEKRERAALHETILQLQQEGRGEGQGEGRSTGGAMGDVPWAELVGTLLELCASSLHALQREVGGREVGSREVGSREVGSRPAQLTAQQAAAEAAAEAHRAAEAVRVRVLSTSLRECERAVIEQAAEAASARGACGEINLAAAAERELITAEVRRREHAEAWAGQLRRMLREGAEVERRLRAQRGCMREELRLCEGEVEAVRGEATAAAREVAATALLQQALRIPSGDSLRQPAAGSTAHSLGASPPAPLASPPSLLSSLLDVNASFTWRGEDFTAPASRDERAGSGAESYTAEPNTAEPNTAEPYTAEPRTADLSFAGPPAARAARLLAGEARHEARHETQRARREARAPRAEQSLSRHSLATEHEEAELVDDISALQSEMDLLIGQHMGDLP